MIELNEAQELIRRTVRGFAEAEIEPIADEIDREDKWPGHLWPMLGELGLLGVTIDERYGGSDAGLLAGVIATEEIARASASVALSYGAHANLCANNIAANGSESQKRRYLPGLCSGAEVGALALTEPEAGSDAVGIRSTAAREGDVYRLNGSKMFITNGSVADTLVLYAKTDPEAGSRGITAFIVESLVRGLFGGAEVGQGGSPRLAHRRAAAGGLPGAGRQCAGAGGRRRGGDDAGVGGRAGVSGRRAAGDCASGAGCGGRLRPRAAAVRAADRRFPADFRRCWRTCTRSWRRRAGWSTARRRSWRNGRRGGSGRTRRRQRRFCIRRRCRVGWRTRRCRFTAATAT